MSASPRLLGSVRRTRHTVVLCVALLLASVSGARADDATGGFKLAVSVQGASTLLVVVRPEPIGKGHIEQGGPFRVFATVTNTSGTAVSAGEVALFIDESGLQAAPARSRALGTLAPGAAREVRWNVLAREAGLYVLTVEATGIEPSGGTVTGDASVVVEVMERSRPGGRPAAAGGWGAGPSKGERVIRSAVGSTAARFK